MDYSADSYLAAYSEVAYRLRVAAAERRFREAVDRLADAMVEDLWKDAHPWRARWRRWRGKPLGD